MKYQGTYSGPSVKADRGGLAANLHGTAWHMFGHVVLLLVGFILGN